MKLAEAAALFVLRLGAWRRGMVRTGILVTAFCAFASLSPTAITGLARADKSAVNATQEWSTPVKCYSIMVKHTDVTTHACVIWPSLISCGLDHSQIMPCHVVVGRHEDDCQSPYPSRLLPFRSQHNQRPCQGRTTLVNSSPHHPVDTTVSFGQKL